MGVAFEARHPAVIQIQGLGADQRFMAHRLAGEGVYPDNSEEALHSLLEDGFGLAEVDVQLTGDGELVLGHGGNPSELVAPGQFGGAESWGQVTLQQLQGAELVQEGVSRTGTVLTLSDLLGETQESGMLIELDPGDDGFMDMVQAVKDAARGEKDIAERIMLGGVNRQRREIVADAFDGQLAPAQIPCINGLTALKFAMGLHPDDDASIPDAYAMPSVDYLLGSKYPSLPLLKPSFLDIVDNDSIASAHERGAGVLVWTVNGPSEAQQLLEAGVDAVITDRPRQITRTLYA